MVHIIRGKHELINAQQFGDLRSHILVVGPYVSRQVSTKQCYRAKAVKYLSSAKSNVVHNESVPCEAPDAVVWRSASSAWECEQLLYPK